MRLDAKAMIYVYVFRSTSTFVLVISSSFSDVQTLEEWRKEHGRADNTAEHGDQQDDEPGTVVSGAVESNK